jgi:hypothetical protein
MNHTPTTYYKGILIEESLERREVLTHVQILKSEISDDGEWHMHTVLVTPEYLEELPQYMKAGAWYAHFWNGQNVIAVFKGRVFRFTYDTKSTWDAVLAYGRSLGLTDEQLDFPIDPFTR